MTAVAYFSGVAALVVLSVLGVITLVETIRTLELDEGID